MGFREEHEKWVQNHLARRAGERRDALVRGHGFGNRLFVEKVWWPLLGHFAGLHPEFEVLDWRQRSYFVDFMWIVGGHHWVIEVMDYGSHGKDRSKYRMDLNRALFLQSLGYGYIEVSLDELKDNPGFVLTMLRSILAPYLHLVRGDGEAVRHPFGKIERQLMRWAMLHERVIHPVKAANDLQLHKQTVIKYCRQLVAKGKLRAVPSGRTGKVYRYEYLGTEQSPDLL